MKQYGYRLDVAEGLADDLAGLSKGLEEAFVSWWNTGDLPEVTVEGHSLKSLGAMGMNPIAAFGVLVWLEEEPEEAKAALAHGYDETR